jgi:uncharacterized protein
MKWQNLFFYLISLPIQNGLSMTGHKIIRMKKTIVTFLFVTVVTALFFLLSSFENNTAKKTQRILVFSKTNGWHHTCIPAGIKALEKMGKENGFVCDFTTDSLQFTSKNLKKYAAVVFLNTTGNVLDDEQQKVFEKYIRSGKGFVGIHSATDTEYGWPWYNQLVGAYFKNHPKQQTAKLIIKDQSFIATRHLPADWSKWDEWYNFKNTHFDKVNVLMTVDESSYTGGQNGESHPVAWYHNFDGGRSFYTALGHTDETYSDPLFVQHLLGGIQYAMGKK